jgi:hypothetical protein
VSALVDFCRAGPGQSAVASLDVEDEPPDGLDGFSVR